MMVERLELFLALARARHFGRAAEFCGVTQPTLSAAIRNLEGELGVLLVHRGSRFQGLTAEGEQVLEWARRIVADSRTMRDEMRAARQGLSGRIRLAVIPTALAMVADLTTPFREKHPGVSFSILSRTSVEMLSMLGNFDVDLGITYLDRQLLGNVLAVPLYVERYMLITTAGAPYCDRDRVTWAEAAELPLCLLTPDMQNRRIIDRHMAQAGVEARPMLESNSIVVLFAHIRTAGWSSILPLSLAERLDFAEPIRAIPIDGPIEGPDDGHLVGLIAVRREPHTPLVTALLGQARTQAELASLSFPAGN